MKSTYKIRIYSPAGELREEVSDFVEMRCLREVNAAGELRFKLLGNHPAVQALETGGRVELWRKNPSLGLDWACESRGLFLRREQTYRDYELFSAACPGPLWLLASRVVAWPERSPGHTLFTDRADSIARTLVGQNAGEEALQALGRLRDGVIDGLLVQEETPAGESLTWEVGRASLLVELQRLARSVKNDFDLVYREDPAGWVFRWYVTQLGADRTETVRFALELGTLAEPAYIQDWQAEKTVAIVAGAETEAGESYLVATGDGYQPGHDREAWVSAPGCETEVEMQSAGQAYLAGRQAIQELKFKVIQSQEVAYGREYGLGDLVSVDYAGQAVPMQVKAVTIVMTPEGEERIEVNCAIR